MPSMLIKGEIPQRPVLRHSPPEGGEQMTATHHATDGIPASPKMRIAKPQSPLGSGGTEVWMRPLG